MFKKKKCPKCNSKINKENRFCSNCGTRLIDNNDGYGMLGKNDLISPQPSSRGFLGGLNDKMMEKMLNSAMKMMEKEMQKTLTNPPKTKVRIMVNGKEIKMHPEEPKIKKQKEIKLPKKTLKGFSKLKQKEPKTSLKRLGDIVLYEIELPNVKSIEDISINQLENSIEIKAKSDKEAYVKLIPISLPITNYEFLKEKLVLEMSGKNQ